MECKLNSIPSGWDDYGYSKTTHVITIDNIKNLTELKLALTEVGELIWGELYTPREYSQYDCTGRYSTSEMERVHRSFTHGTLLVIYNEFGSRDI